MECHRPSGEPAGAVSLHAATLHHITSPKAVLPRAAAPMGRRPPPDRPGSPARESRDWGRSPLEEKSQPHRERVATKESPQKPCVGEEARRAFPARTGEGSLSQGRFVPGLRPSGPRSLAYQSVNAASPPLVDSGVPGKIAAVCTSRRSGGYPLGIQGQVTAVRLR